MSQFTINRLTNGKTLVRGTDQAGTTGQCTVDSTQWDDVNARRNFHGAEKDFDAAVEEFFAPLIEATEKLAAAGKGTEVDPISYVVMQEEVEGQPHTAAVVERLNQDSVILRLIEADDTDRLVWVSETELAVLEVLPGTAPAPVAPVVEAGDPHFNEAEATGTMING